jgi:hypothetical protein
VTFESFVSVCWRLVPYYLNQWEAKWGAECTSMVRAGPLGSHGAAGAWKGDRTRPCAVGSGRATYDALASLMPPE